mmetsp:Transcript_48699/g.139239  ORF Transcript_48699/g.139239 Transcript_48699/m.139239 type:complete len:243 (-) Transcript_48699:594-1322(-)
MKSTHWSTQAVSSICSTTCDTAMTAALACLQLAPGACQAARISLKRIVMKTSSSSFSARVSRFASAMPTTSSSTSSSLSSLPSSVHTATSSSTSSIHSMFRPTSLSREAWPSGLQKSSERPRASDLAASMAVCRTSASAKVFGPQAHNSMRVPQRAWMPLSLKKSGSSSMAETSAVRVSFNGSSHFSLANRCRAAITAGMTAAIGAASSASRLSTSSSAKAAPAAATSGNASVRVDAIVAVT